MERYHPVTSPVTASYHLSYVAPGGVSNLTGNPTLTSIELTWTPPMEPNGVLISYEVAFTVDGGRRATANTTGLSTTYTISLLTPGTRVSAMSVTVYNDLGQGQTVYLEDDLQTLSTLRKHREGF